MQVRLELRDGRQAGAERATELLTPFSIGTRQGVTWLLRGVDDREGTATLRRNESGGIVVEADGEVSVDGKPAAEGRSNPMPDSGIIIIAGRQVQVVVERGLGAMSFEDTMPSISSILSDVTPGGETALGPLPGRELHSVLDAPQQPRPAAARFWQEPKAFEEPAPPLPVSKTVFLPDDWDEVVELTNRSTQSAAPLGRTNINPTEPAQAAPRAPAKAPAGDTVPLLQAAGITALEADDMPPAVVLANAGTGLVQALQALARIEDQLLGQFAELGVTAPDPGESARYALHPAAVLSDRNGLLLEAMQQRIGTILSMQRALSDASRKVLADARKQLDPAAISTAGTARRGMAAKLAPAIGSWAEYQARFAPADGAAPLSPAALTKEINILLRRKDQTEDQK
ncbi:hypothetical protein [Paracoccus sp. (in: a-proteobacteria)]|uniref:hypothetical protein n=1 Tax=Paracoccus sp. TaxID=267 RepID=UPI003A8B6672